MVLARWAGVGGALTLPLRDFAHTLKLAGRTKTVGTATSGAGYNNMTFPLMDETVISISIGAAFYPTTGQRWEGAGVEPDIAVPAEQALAVARAEVARAEQHPVAVPAAALARYAGTYGNRVVMVDGDRLLYQRRRPSGRCADARVGDDVRPHPRIPHRVRARRTGRRHRAPDPQRRR